MAWPEAGGIDVSLEVKSHSGETKKFKRYETMVQRAFGTQINAWVFFFSCAYQQEKSAEPWVHELENRGNIYCCSKYSCALGLLHTGAHTPAHT